jgi:hypothetical protein
MGDQLLDRGSDIGTADQIAGEQAPLRDRHDCAEGRDAVLQRDGSTDASISAMAATGLRTLWPLMM